MLVALAVIVIGVAVSLPHFATFGTSGRLRRATAELAATIERLIVQSQRDRRTIELILGPGYYLAQREHAERAELIELHTLRAPVELRVREGQKLRLSPQGIASPLTLIVLDGASRCQIAVALRGRVTVTC